MFKSGDPDAKKDLATKQRARQQAERAKVLGDEGAALEAFFRLYPETDASGGYGKKRRKSTRRKSLKENLLKENLLKENLLKENHLERNL